MSSASSSLRIAPSERTLPLTTPHLMPFHIAYSGPAPISTYFRVRDAPEPTYGRDTKTAGPSPEPTQSQDVSDSQATLVASSSTSSARADTLGPASSSATVVDVDVQGPANGTPDTDSRHFTAAFRGRSMHGIKVDLPDGYAGVVLRAPEDGKGKSTAPSSRAAAEQQDSKARVKAKSKGAGRNTRQAKRAVEVVDVDEEMADEGAADDQDEGPVRVLRPEARFSSFVLWHPDMPVDEGRDEYLRSLTEWTRLAAEIHRVDDL